MSTQDIFLDLEDAYPGLVVMEDGKMYLSDRTIYSDPLKFDEVRNYMTFRLYGNGFEIFMAANQPDQKSYGHLFMDYDFKLPLNTCLWLFSYDINISYKPEDESQLTPDASGAQSTFLKYDREGMLRMAAIDNIIK